MVARRVDKKYDRIVVKVGSSTLTENGGKLNYTRIEHILHQLVALKNKDRDVLLVTSGAIGAGMGEMGLKKKPRLIRKQQAAAAVGQGQLIALYNKILAKYDEKGGQILMTASDLKDRTRYLNAFNTLVTLLEYEIIPIINENDTVATEEIQFGDNDTLAARVAGLVEADLLINLTDTEGLYDGDPAVDGEDINLISCVEKINPEIEKVAGGEGSRVGTGGMYTKIEAARIATESGITMFIGPGYREDIIPEAVTMLEENKGFSLGTTFLPVADALPKRKQWFCFNLDSKGSLIIDDGAENALLNCGKSLLPGGIIEVQKKFQRGDLVNIKNKKREVIAKGLVNYSAGEIRQIRGHHSREIYDILGFINQEEVLHRDNMVILKCE